MANVTLRSARTQEEDDKRAAEELVSRVLDGPPPKLVTLFAARNRDHAALNQAVRERLPKSTRLIGASTGGEIDNQGMHMGSVLLSALSGDLEVGLGFAKNMSADASSAGAAAVKRACEELGVKQSELDTRKYVGMVIDDGFKFKKEELLLGVLEKNQGMVVVGGGASDIMQIDPTRQSAVVHADGEVATDSALVALFKTDAPWAALRSHWYEPTGQTLTVSRVEGPRVLEIDGKPAAARYAELLGVTVEDLEFGKPKGFSASPTALRVGREYFLRAPFGQPPDGSILFANFLEEGTELELMRQSDPIESTRKFFEEEVPRRVRNPKAAVLFQCGGRAFVAHMQNKIPELSATFAAAPPCAGFNCFFEVHCGFAINTTLTSLVFGGDA
jgi:hypothetical protein